MPNVWLQAAQFIQSTSALGRLLSKLASAVQAGSNHEVLTARPASASSKSTTPATDCPFNIEFAGWSRIEATLDFGLQPSKLLAAALLMQHRRNYCSVSAAIRTLAHLRSNELLERGRELYGDDGRHHLSIGDKHGQQTK
jgi:hypothetical protein